MKRFFLLILVALMAVAQCATAQDAPRLDQVAPETVAVVNGQAITRDELAAMAIGLYGSQTLETLVRHEVIRQEAARRGVAVTEAEIDVYVQDRVKKQLDDMARQMGAENAEELTKKAGKPPESLAELRRNSEAALRPFVGPELLMKKMMEQEIKISDQDVRTAFERQYGPKVKALQIVLRTRADAEQVLNKLKLGAEFGQMARDISVDAVSGRAGGELPPLGKGSILGDAAFALKPGETSGIIETPDGFHLLKLMERIPATNVVLADVADELRASLMAARIAAQRESWLANLESKADVKRTLRGAF